MSNIEELSPGFAAAIALVKRHMSGQPVDLTTVDPEVRAIYEPLLDICQMAALGAAAQREQERKVAAYERQQRINNSREIKLSFRWLMTALVVLIGSLTLSAITNDVLYFLIGYPLAVVVGLVARYYSKKAKALP